MGQKALKGNAAPMCSVLRAHGNNMFTTFVAFGLWWLDSMTTTFRG